MLQAVVYIAVCCKTFGDDYNKIMHGNTTAFKNDENVIFLLYF